MLLQKVTGLDFRVVILANGEDLAILLHVQESSYSIAGSYENVSIFPDGFD